MGARLTTADGKLVAGDSKGLDLSDFLSDSVRDFDKNNFLIY